MIILSDDIIFRKAVIHLLNVELGKFAPAQDLFMMQPDVIELVRKQVCYLLNSDELKAADWNTKEPVFQKLEQMNEKDDKSFIQTSAYLADRLFDIMCDSVEIPSADLLYLSFQTNQEIYEVTNDARLDLPKTGGWMDYLPLAGGMILILGGLFVYYRKKKGGLKEEL